MILKTLFVLLPTLYFGSQMYIAFVTKALRNGYGKYHSLNVHVFFLLTLLKKLLPLLGRAFRDLFVVLMETETCVEFGVCFFYSSAE